jgi:hypothetical protein
MPNLAQMFAMCNTKSQFSRQPGEIYDALSEAGFFVYAAVLKELSNFFLKFDTTTITLQPGVQIYYLPPDCTQIVNLSERFTASGRWRPIEPESVSEAVDDARQNTSWSGYGYGNRSEFRYAGPFLQAQDITGTSPGSNQGGFGVGGYQGTGYQVQSIMISPTPAETRYVEIAYVAKWVPIINAQSYLMLPDECTHAMQSFAIAELLRSNNDSLAVAYDQKGQQQLDSALTWVRARQIQQNPRITPYVEGDDDGGYAWYY